MRREDAHYAQISSMYDCHQTCSNGSETWALRKPDQNLLERTEMKMLRGMMGIKRIEKIRNKSKGRCGKHK